ncbi:MAG: Lrp/AsnC family transcriptional regulator [Rhizomicrobium sp.]
MRTHVLDSVDLRILSALQIKGRATNVEIAEYAAITAPPALRRTRTLEEQRVIHGYYAVLDAKKLGYDTCAFIQVRLESQAAPLVREFEALMRDVPNVRECHALSGQRDFLLKCVFRNLADAQHFVTETLLKTGNVASVVTSFCIHVTKNEPDVPLALVEAPPPPSAARKLKLLPLPRT